VLKPTQLDQMTKRSMWAVTPWAETPCPETSHGAMNRLPVHPWSGYGPSRCRLDSVQIIRRGLACPSIGDNVESDLLSLAEDTHASAFYRADVDEDILAAIIWLNEAEAFLVVEPLHGSFCHIAVLSGTCLTRPHVSAANLFEIWRKVVSPDAGCAARPSRSAELDYIMWRFSARLQGYPARVFEKRLAIWPASPHLRVALGFIIPRSAVTQGHKGHGLSEHRYSTA
jgi:hypothetical protein